MNVIDRVLCASASLHDAPPPVKLSILFLTVETTAEPRNGVSLNGDFYRAISELADVGEDLLAWLKHG